MASETYLAAMGIVRVATGHRGERGMALYHLNERVEYIGLGHHAGTIVAVHPGVAPYEVQWDDPKVRNTRHTQYQIARPPPAPKEGTDERD